MKIMCIWSSPLVELVFHVMEKLIKCHQHQNVHSVHMHGSIVDGSIVVASNYTEVEIQCL
jgi:hypothetical protein